MYNGYRVFSGVDAADGSVTSLLPQELAKLHVSNLRTQLKIMKEQALGFNVSIVSIVYVTQI